MARRAKRKHSGVQGAFARAIENGVDVSVYGHDRGYEGLPAVHKDARDGIVLMEMQQSAREKRATVAYRTNHVDRLKADGRIDARLFDCAGYFRADVALALASGYKQSALEIISGGGGEGRDVIRNDKAYRKVREVILLLGGNKSDMTAAAFAFIVDEKSMSAWAGRSSHKRLTARGNLIDALHVIADYYYPLKKKR